MNLKRSKFILKDSGVLTIFSPVTFQGKHPAQPHPQTKEFGHRQLNSMLILDSNAFKLFVQDNRRVYPYRDVLTTRNRMHISWLMMKCKYSGSIGRIQGIPTARFCPIFRPMLYK